MTESASASRPILAQGMDMHRRERRHAHHQPELLLRSCEWGRRKLGGRGLLEAHADQTDAMGTPAAFTGRSTGTCAVAWSNIYNGAANGRFDRRRGCRGTSTCNSWGWFVCRSLCMP